MSKKPFPVLAVVIGLVALAAGVFLSQKFQPAPPTGYPGLGGEFTLMSDQGKVSLSDFEGKAVALYFGYTFCPDICPTSLAALGQGLKKFSADEQKQIQPIFITVDPERDTPERLAEYTQHFHPNMIGLTSDMDTITKLAKRYGVFFAKANMGDSAVDYAMDHSSIIFVVGPNGVVQKLVKEANSPESIHKALAEVLQTL